MITFSKTQETNPTLGPSGEAQAAQTQNRVSLILSRLSSATMETSGTPGRTGITLLSCLSFLGVSRSLRTWNLPVFLLTVTCRPRLSPTNHLSSSRPCKVFKLLQDPRSLRRATHPPEPIPRPGRLHTHLNQSHAWGGYTPTWTSPVPGAVWAVSSDVILQYLQGISPGIQVCSSLLCKLLQYLLITYAHSPLL